MNDYTVIEDLLIDGADDGSILHITTNKMHDCTKETNMDILQMINDALDEKIRNIDIEGIVEDMIYDIIEDNFDEDAIKAKISDNFKLDLESKVLDAMDEKIDDMLEDELGDLIW